ncbi:MAG: PHP domain-containing protein [Eubacteriales bacterium]|nr:PHP domain-containing protein [Eubacteriales bacterium]
MAQIDLHMHSSFSLDGELSPRDLAEECSRAGITLASLTDHNSVEGVSEFSWRCAQLGIRAIPGVELDCILDTLHLHVLGYGVDVANAALLRLERSVQNMQRQCAEAQMDAVESLGILFDREQVLEHSKNGMIAAEMIAEAALAEPINQKHKLLQPLFPGGDLSDQPLVNFYWELCAPGKPAYVPIHFISAEDAVCMIHEAGGIAVLAHPGANIGADRDMLSGVLQLPLDGIEAFSSYHNALITAFYLEEAKERGLLVTAGTDFHGNTKPNVKIGDIDILNMEESLQEELFCALETSCGYERNGEYT